MTTKTKVGCAIGIVGLFITTPIWYYLLYQILKTVNASDVMWLLYWIYVPVSVIIAVASRFVESAFEE